MDTIVIAAIRSAATAAPFAAANKLTSGLQSLTFPFVVQLMPMVSDLHARGRDAEIVRRFTIATRIALQLTLPFAIAFSLFATDIVDVWLGSGAPDVTATIIVVLMGVQVVTLSAFPAEKVLVGVGRVRAVRDAGARRGVVEPGAFDRARVRLRCDRRRARHALHQCRARPDQVSARLPGNRLRDAQLAARELLPATLSSLPAVAAMAAVWLVLPSGVLRLLVGLTLGIGTAFAIAAVQVGPRETIATLRTMRASAAPEAI